MSIILIRHGETAFNVARILQPADTPLSERGQRQAHAVAQRFAGARVGAIVSSDLARAEATARAIAEACGLTIRFSPLLQERNFGDLRGLPYDGLGYDPISMEEAPPGGESMAMLHDRVDRALAFLREARAEIDSDLLVVSHGFFIRTLLARRVQMPDAMAAPLRIDNTSISILSPDARHRASVVNNTDHLTGDLRDTVGKLSGF
jgi:2,3-bisphosphoglycerate-dependent phosphoglycerate mutase